MAGARPSAPRVSVVTAVYNGERYVHEAVESILAQTFTDFEYLIVDDGSTDGTAGILKEMASRDSRISVVHHDHLGIPRSLNRGTGLSHGEFIARQDGDDISTPERLAREVAFLERHPGYGAVGSFYLLIDEFGSHLKRVELRTSAEEIRALSIGEPCFIHGSLLLRRSALLAIGGYRPEFPVCSDLDLWLRLTERFDAANLPEVLYHHRVNPDSVTARLNELQFHYVAIAQEFARQRREEGRDVLMPGSASSSSSFTPA